MRGTHGNCSISSNFNLLFFFRKLPRRSVINWSWLGFYRDKSWCEKVGETLTTPTTLVVRDQSHECRAVEGTGQYLSIQTGGGSDKALHFDRPTWCDQQIKICFSSPTSWNLSTTSHVPDLRMRVDQTRCRKLWKLRRSDTIQTEFTNRLRFASPAQTQTVGCPVEQIACCCFTFTWRDNPRCSDLRTGAHASALTGFIPSREMVRKLRRWSLEWMVSSVSADVCRWTSPLYDRWR